MKGIKFKKHNEDYYSRPLYEVGDLYITTKSENPSSRFGGTWELYGPGRTLVCIDTSQTEFNTIKKTGGSKTHSHSQGATGAAAGSTGSTALNINQIPSHTHTSPLRYLYCAKGSSDFWGAPYTSGDKGTMNVSYTGGSQGHTHTLNNHTHTNPNTNASSNLQPFITCYVWIRTA